MCGMTHLYLWHDSFICVTWLIRMCDMTHLYVWHYSFRCVTWLIYMCDMTHSYVWHDPFICVIWHIHMCETTHSYVCHDSGSLSPFVQICDTFICAPWLIQSETWLIQSETWLIYAHPLCTSITNTRVFLSQKRTYMSVIQVLFVTEKDLMFVSVYRSLLSQKDYRVAKTHRIPHLYRSFSAKVTYI